MRRAPCSCPARLLVSAAAVLAFACVSGSETETPAEITTPMIDSAFVIDPGTTFDAIGAARFGGLSGLAFDVATGNLLGISDDRENPRVFRLQVRESPFSIVPIGVIQLQGTPVALDPEALVVLPSGHLLVASEGVQNSEPRSPPGLFEYTSDGVFQNTLDLRERFLPPLTGPITRGVRGNSSFEALTVSVDGNRLFVGLETALAQDGEPATFDRGARARILEYNRKGSIFSPGREWMYELEPLPRPTYKPGLMINGLVELVALDSSHLLALERSFIEDADDPAHSMNRIQLYRVALDGGDDVSAVESIAGRVDLTPLPKQLLLDLDSAQGLPAALKASNLENFEGMAFGPAPPQGGRRLFIVSDDNFGKDQRTWFLRMTF